MKKVSYEKSNNPICRHCQPFSTMSLDRLTTPAERISPYTLFYTLSPDATGPYGDMKPAQQKLYIDSKFNSALKDINKDYTIYGYTIHYEFNKNNNLHTHGFLLLDKPKQIKVCIAHLSKTFHTHIGRKGLYSNYSCTIKENDDSETYEHYVNKENVYEPQHYTSIIITKTNKLPNLHIIEQYNSIKYIQYNI